jgi:antitoxin component of MazEF toxin-antitoxin module
MKERFVKIVRRNGDSLALNIPSEIIKLLGIKENDMIRVEIEKIKNGTK